MALPKTVYILGAGFSKCASLPVQNEFSKLLLSDEFDSRVSVAITSNLRLFLRSSFSWQEGDEPPSMEDIFTCIDLSAGSGHYLGPVFGPKHLRAIRRMLIYRIFEILNHTYKPSVDIAALLGRDIGKVGFVVLNWDVVLEKHWESIGHYGSVGIDYGTDYKFWHPTPQFKNNVRVAKVHGSSNWVYCDNCRHLFVDPFSKLSLEVRAGLLEEDFRLFSPASNPAVQGLGVASCPTCATQVGPHIATFSYRKSFRSHAFANSWQFAEKLLTAAKHWVFIGYSMPAADYEFKHLMKTCELRARPKQRKQIEAVVRNDGDARSRFEGFFGQKRIKVHMEGLSGYLLDKQKANRRPGCLFM